MRKNLIPALLLISVFFTGCNNTREMKITDLHVHLKGKLTIDDAVAKSKAENIEYGIAVN